MAHEDFEEYPAAATMPQAMPPSFFPLLLPLLLLLYLLCICHCQKTFSAHLTCKTIACEIGRGRLISFYLGL